MKSINWEYSLCVACGKCIKACHESIGKVMCNFTPVLGDDNFLYSWACNATNADNSLHSKCDFACKSRCPQKAIS